MKKLALLFALAFALCGAAQAQPVGPPAIGCNQISASGTLTAGTTELVAGVTGKAISFCGFNVDGLAAGSFQLVFGTGATCTTSTAISHVITTAAGQHHVDHIAVASKSSNQAQSLCIVVTGTNSLAIAVYYSIN